MNIYKLTKRQNDVLDDVINWDDGNTSEFGYRVYSSSSGTKAYESYMFDFEYYKGSYEFTIYGHGQTNQWSLDKGLKKDIVRKILSYIEFFKLNNKKYKGDLLVCRRLIRKLGGVA